MRGGRVAVVGSLNVDLVWHVAALPRPGQTVLALRTEEQFGGKGANQAVAAARQGARVTMVGAVGADAHGHAYRTHLAQEGIAIEHVSAVSTSVTGSAHVYVEPAGENLIVVNPGANAHLEPTVLAAVVPAQDVVLVQLESTLAAATEALRLAAAHGVRGVLNASPATAAFPWGAQRVEAVVVNEHECVACFGRAPAELMELSLTGRAQLLAEFALGHLIITQGAESTLHLAAEVVQEIPTYPVQPRDTVGAGDTFAGALAAELARGQEWNAALRYANVAAALSTLAVGAQTAIPRRAEVEAALRQIA